MKDTETVQFTAGELRQMARDCDQFRQMLERAKPEVLQEGSKVGCNAQVFIGPAGPDRKVYISHYLQVNGYEEVYFALQSLGGRAWSRLNDNRTIPAGLNLHPMKTGYVTIYVKDGIAEHVSVRESGWKPAGPNRFERGEGNKFAILVYRKDGWDLCSNLFGIPHLYVPESQVTEAKSWANGLLAKGGLL